MKVFKVVAIVLIVGALLLAGCHGQEHGEITEIRFNRGHGSLWGNQFYIEIREAEILRAEYIPEGSGELVTAEHLPITQDQWQKVKSTIETLPLEKARTNIWEKQKLDGSEFRELTLVRGKQETTYYWPNTPEAQRLEQFLEALLAESLP